MTNTCVTDGHTGWACDAVASLIVESWTRDRRPHTLHAVIYTCPNHQYGAEERIATAGMVPEVTPAPPAHRRDSWWPCGHITTYDTVGEALLLSADTRS